MPNPNPGESKKDYIGRFMKSGEAQSDFPDEKQRLAVAYSMYEKKNAGPFGTAEHPWPKMYTCSFIEPGVVFYQDLGECRVCGNAFSCGEGKCDTEGATILVKQEALERMAKSFVGKPVIDMIHKDIEPSMVADGEADGIVTRVWLDGKTGWWMAEFLVWDPDTQRHCESPAYSVSCAYEPEDVDTSGGEYHNLPYAEEILSGEYTHLAIVTNPRYEGARILVNSKGGKMSWRFWEKGARKNAAPIDPEKTMVNIDGKDVPLSHLYEAAKADEPMLNDDTVLEVDGKEKKLGELKQAYRNKMAADAKAAEEKKNAEGEKVKTSAPADKGAGSHVEGGKDAFKHAGACEHCKHPAFNEKDGKGEEEKLPDLRHDQAEETAKKGEEIDTALELKQKADDEAKTAEEKKNADDAAALAEEKKNADKEKAEALANAKERGRKSFADLRNSRLNGDSVKIDPVSIDDRLEKGKQKYGSAA